MINKTGDDITKVRDQAIAYYRKLGDIECPAFSKKIRVNYDGLSHIEYKDKKHRRSNQEIFMRYLCFLNIEQILCNMKLYQEYKAYIKEIEVEREGHFIKQKLAVQEYGFVAIVKHGDDRHRIKVVVREVYGWEKIDFVSVFPARKLEGYTNFFSDDEEREKYYKSNLKKKKG